MRQVLGRAARVLGILCLTATFAFADAKIELLKIGPEDALGASVSKHGNHVAVLAPKGSRWAVTIDGVEGPKIDALLQNITGGPVGGSYWIGQIPVAWSPQGDHSAYAAKVGDQYVLYYDGKELTRGPIRNAGQINIGLSFSNNGKHFYFMDSDDAGKYRIVADGKPGPGSALPPQLMLSPDGDHYAYVGYENSRGPEWGMVDGRQVNYFGDQLQYTAKNHLLSTIQDNNSQTFVLDGKPEIKATSIGPMWVSPDGAQIGMLIEAKPNDPRVLMINGKPIPGTEGVPVMSVYFSPDGKRWAALCQTKTGSKYMLIDGKKGSEYQDIPQSITSFQMSHWYSQTANNDLANGLDRAGLIALQPSIPGFTADSSKFIYEASQEGRTFEITEDQESDGYKQIMERFLATGGVHFGFIALSNNYKQHVVVDGKDMEYPSTNVPSTVRISKLTFSPSGNHYAFIYGQNVCLDGVAQPGMINGEYVFSPDEKHLGFLGRAKDHPCYIVDGKIVVPDYVGNLNFAFFTADSKHLIVIGSRNLQGTKDSKAVYVDGKMVTHFADSNDPKIFELEPDGTLTFCARTDDEFKKFKITFDTDIDAVVAAAPVASDK